MKNAESSKSATDALREAIDNGKAAESEMTSLAGKLERERDKARTELGMWRDGNIMHEIHMEELKQTEQERDEARLQYSTTLVFCQSLVKARLEQMEVAGE